MYYHFRIHGEEDGFWAECLELTGCDTEGDDLDELEKKYEGSFRDISYRTGGFQFNSAFTRNLQDFRKISLE